MEQMDLDNLSKEELFTVVKDKCKSRAKKNLWIGLALMIVLLVGLVVLFLNEKGINSLRHTQIVSLISFALYLLLGCWLVLDNYRFLKIADGLGTPEQLLYWYKKKVRTDSQSAFLAILIYTISFTDSVIYYNRDDVPLMIISLAIVVAIIGLFFYKYIKGGLFRISPHDEDIIRVLTYDLAEKE